MMKIIAITISFICFVLTAKSDQFLTWKHLNPYGKDSIEVHMAPPEELIIPFLWSKIRKSDIEELIQKNADYDSIMASFNNKENIVVPEKIITATFLQLTDKMIRYDAKSTFNVNGEKITVYKFTVGKGSEIIEDACYHLYYSNKLGFISCVYYVYGETTSFNENKFVLIDVKDIQGNSLSDSHLLQQVIVAIENFQWQ